MPDVQHAPADDITLPATPEGWPARLRCDSCDGRGDDGERHYQGEFQPPEAGRCGECDGRGYHDEESAYGAEHMQAYARAAVIADRASPSRADGWMDIASAPKDGAEIILRRGGRVGAAIWCTWPGNESEEAGAGWSIGFDGDSWDDDKAPTHWRHRPAAPGSATVPAAVDVGAAQAKGGQDEFDAWRQS